MISEVDVYVAPRHASRPSIKETLPHIGNILHVSIPQDMSGPNTLEQYSSVFKLRASCAPESPQMHKTLNAIVRVFNSLVRFNKGSATTAFRRLTRIVPVVNYDTCENISNYIVDYFNDTASRSIAMALGKYIEVLFVSLMWKPNASKLSAWLVIAEHHDIAICIPCHDIINVDDTNDHMNSYQHNYAIGDSMVYECYQCGVDSDDPEFRETHEKSSSHLNNLELYYNTISQGSIV